MLTLQGLQVAWTYAKKYAWIVFAVIAGVLGMILFVKSPTDMADQIDAINKRHADEIARIRAADDAQLKEHEANQRRLEDALKMLDDRYRVALSKLDVEKQAEVDRVLKEHEGDPAGLAAELAAVLGLQVQ